MENEASNKNDDDLQNIEYSRQQADEYIRRLEAKRNYDHLNGITGLNSPERDLVPKALSDNEINEFIFALELDLSEASGDAENPLQEKPVSEKVAGELLIQPAADTPTPEHHEMAPDKVVDEVAIRDKLKARVDEIFDLARNDLFDDTLGQELWKIVVELIDLGMTPAKIG